MAPARGSDPVHPIENWAQGWGDPCQHSAGVCPQGQCPSLPAPWALCRDMGTPPRLQGARGIPRHPGLSSFHLPACSDPGIPQSRSCQSQAHGCAPRERWSFSERFGCTPPCGDRTGQEVAEEPCPRGRDHRVAAWTWLFPSLLWM